LNIEIFPKIGNVYDSLAEAYEISKNKEEAIKYYKKSLEVIEKNPHSVQVSAFENSKKQLDKLLND
jgi:tetratricopeptide (TPR) repeat protein